MTRRWGWTIIGVGLLLLVFVLHNVLAPFLVAAGLAYLGDPVVDRLQRWKLSRGLAVTVVFVAIYASAILLVLILFPPLQRQVTMLMQSLPDYLQWLQQVALPWLGHLLPGGYTLDTEALKQAIAEHWTKAGGLVPGMLELMSKSGLTLITIAADIVLIPVVSFYLMRDWNGLVNHISDLIPRDLLPTASALAKKADAVLSEFVRGQLLVMLALAIYYSVTLWIAGLDLALLVGVTVGLIAFVPYLGFIFGILAASIAILVQTQDFHSLIAVGIIFTLGQLLESYILTPRLVGERIGLHPVAVIFAVMAGGQLFGFAGVLLALPAAAVIAVLFWHVRGRWMESDLYRGQ